VDRLERVRNVAKGSNHRAAIRAAASSSPASAARSRCAREKPSNRTCVCDAFVASAQKAEAGEDGLASSTAPLRSLQRWLLRTAAAGWRWPPPPQRLPHEVWPLRRAHPAAAGPPPRAGSRVGILTGCRPENLNRSGSPSPAKCPDMATIRFLSASSYFSRAGKVCSTCAKAASWAAISANVTSPAPSCSLSSPSVSLCRRMILSVATICSLRLASLIADRTRLDDGVRNVASS
jgi:hypothetical protein